MYRSFSKSVYDAGKFQPFLILATLTPPPPLTPYSPPSHPPTPHSLLVTLTPPTPHSLLATLTPSTPHSLLAALTPLTPHSLLATLTPPTPHSLLAPPPPPPPPFPSPPPPPPPPPHPSLLTRSPHPSPLTHSSTRKEMERPALFLLPNSNSSLVLYFHSACDRSFVSFPVSAASWDPLFEWGQ